MQGKTVACLGVGTGLEALTAAVIGARRVLAYDVSELALSLLKEGTRAAKMSAVVEPIHLDLCDADAAGACFAKAGIDVLLCADVLYNEQLARCIGTRVGEAFLASAMTPDWLLLTDSQRFPSTGPALYQSMHAAAAAARAEGGISEDEDELLLRLPEWQHTVLPRITGSGVLIEEDVCSDHKVRYLSWRWQEEEDSINGALQWRIVDDVLGP